MNRELIQTCLQTAVSASRSAGGIIMENLGRLSSTDIQTKQAFDFVTEVDRQSEAMIIKTIHEKFPSHTFLAEETVKHEKSGGYRWIIDPLDGTTNYIHSYPHFAVSIALESAGEIVLGVVFDPVRNELFHAVRNEGTFLNNTPVQISSVRDPGKSIIATGFPFRTKHMMESYLTLFKEIFVQVGDLRRAGSAALDLAYVAAGRCDGFFELSLSPWDIAAGSLLITEAAGVVTDFSGGQGYMVSGNIVAGTPEVHNMLLSVTKHVFAGADGP